MKKYETDLLFGTFVTLIGYILLIGLSFVAFLSWMVIIIGKVIVFFSIGEYVDYKRAVRGEDLEKDHFIRKEIRKIRRKRY